MEKMYVVLGNLFHCVEMELYKTGEVDIWAAQYFFSGCGGEVEGGLKIRLK